MVESETCSSLSSNEATGHHTDLTTLAGQSVSWGTPVKTAHVTPLTDESNTPLFPSEIPCKEGDITQLVDQSVSPPLDPSNTPYKLDHGSSLADQSGSSFQSETPWKLADVIPSLDQPYSHNFLLSEPEAVFPQRYQFSVITFRRFRGFFCVLIAFFYSWPLEGWDESKKHLRGILRDYVTLGPCAR